MKTLPLTVAAAGLLALCGCQTPHQFAQPGSNWVTYAGQLRYSNPKNSVIGGTVVSFVPVHHFQLDFFAGPGFPLLKLKEEPQFARAEGSLARGRWRGEPDTAPARLANWFSLHEVFNTLAAQRWGTSPRRIQSLTAGRWTAEVTGRNGRPAKVDVTFPGNGERFQFVFDETE